MTNDGKPMDYILGLDLGASSLGWAIVETSNGKPVALRHAGVRIFDAGVEGDIEAGKDASRAVVRREKRLPRRQHWRRARRQRKLFGLLRKHGLLPETESSESNQRHSVFESLDKEILAKFSTAESGTPEFHREHQLLPYKLRALAVHERLEPFELGRALYHLGQRRGFLSNRKSEAKPDEELGVVKKGITDLEEAVGGKTLGEYLATLDPAEERIRRRWTSRKMYTEEFERIWQEQAKHHSPLTPELKKEIHGAIFFQRPLKSQTGLVGHCELEPDKRRAAISLPVAQEFRVLQAVNHLTLVQPDGLRRPLDPEERKSLRESLHDKPEMTYAAVRKLLELPRGATFTIEAGGEKKIIGNRTRSRMIEAMGQRWDRFSPEEQEQVVYDVLHYQKRDALIRRARKAWKLTEEQAKLLADTSLEDGYARHSKLALRKLSAAMQDGTVYATARKEVYPEVFQAGEVHDLLPPVKEAFPELRNPAVSRALTELRKVVNGLVRKFGKPATIRIEMARDLKRSRAERKRLTNRMRDNEKKRAKAKAKVFQELGIERPRRSDIEKVLLAEECNWECPYTGRCFGIQDILGASCQFDIEHIFPRRYLDNSFVNKTLCYHVENRDVKRDRLPYQAYSHDAKRYQEILQRVASFQGSAAHEKLRRFRAESVPEDFVNRQLNDTRYNSTLAKEYLGLLYGGEIDERHKRRVEGLTGGITAHLRREWQLNYILGEGEKTREDHRHHAVDAVVIALTDASAVQLLQTGAERASELGSHRIFEAVPVPWSCFVDDVRSVIDAINVSFRPRRKLAGALHGETNYSKQTSDKEGKKVYKVRKELHKLSPSELVKIVDERIAQLVKDKLAELGGGQPSKVFSDVANHPSLPTKDGREIPIHKVRVVAKDTPRTLGKGVKEKRVTSAKGSNHHTVIVAQLDDEGNEIEWEHHVVTRLQAVERAGQLVEDNRHDIVQRDWGPTTRFKFSLCANECVIADDEEGHRTLYRVAKLSAGEIQLWEHWQAKPDNSKRNKWNQIRSIDSLRKRKTQKVLVTPIGEIKPAGG